MKIVVLNTHSVLNSGDAAIVLGQVGLLREIFGDPRIAITSRTPDQDRAFYREIGVDVLPPLFTTPSLLGSPWAKLAGCARGLASVQARRRLVAEIRGADLVIGSGGGYFFSTRRWLPGPAFAQVVLQVSLAERAGKPVVFAPQSFGPFANRFAARTVRKLLSHATVKAVLVREGSSLDLVQGLLRGTASPPAVSLCPDLAFLLEHDGPDGEPLPALPPPVLAVATRDWLFPGGRSGTERQAVRRAHLAELTRTCLEFHRRWGGSIRVFAQARGPGRIEDDRVISAELVALLRQAVPASHLALTEIAEAASPRRVLAALSSSDLVLASRLHAAILAMVAGKPAIALGYQPKGLGVMRTLGLERYCLPIEDLEAGRVLALVEELLADRDFVAQRVRPAVAAARSRIRAAMGAVLAPYASA